MRASVRGERKRRRSREKQTPARSADDERAPRASSIARPDPETRTVTPPVPNSAFVVVEPVPVPVWGRNASSSKTPANAAAPANAVSGLAEREDRAAASRAPPNNPPKRETERAASSSPSVAAGRRASAFGSASGSRGELRGQILKGASARRRPCRSGPSRRRRRRRPPPAVASGGRAWPTRRSRGQTPPPRSRARAVPARTRTRRGHAGRPPRGFRARQRRRRRCQTPRRGAAPPAARKRRVVFRSIVRFVFSVRKNASLGKFSTSTGGAPRVVRHALHEPAQPGRCRPRERKSGDRPRVVRVADGASVLVADDTDARHPRRTECRSASLPQAADQALQRDGLLLRETSRRGEHEDERVHSCGFKARAPRREMLCV